VHRVDFRSGISYLDGHGERARPGIGGGPELVITNLAVFEFEPGSQQMRLKSVHDGITVEQALASTGFEPVVPSDVPVTAPPTAEQVSLLRHGDRPGRLPQARPTRCFQLGSRLSWTR
jgi:glutaconate CoA-transferase subunit B